MVDLSGISTTCVGGNCTLITTAEAYYAPNAVVEGSRANWEFAGTSGTVSPFDVYEEGLDGNFGATADNQVFMRLGLFNP